MWVWVLNFYEYLKMKLITRATTPIIEVKNTIIIFTLLSEAFRMVKACNTD